MSECITSKRYKKIKQIFNLPITIKLIKNYQNYFSAQNRPPPNGLINKTRQLIYENLVIKTPTGKNSKSGLRLLWRP